MKRRWDRTKLVIGAHALAPYARREEHIRDIVACGVDCIVCMDPDYAALDLFAKYGLGAFVRFVVPEWWGGCPAGKMAEINPLARYEAAADAFTDHPAIWGIDVGDEPSALDFSHYSKVVPLVERRFPAHFAYLNLYPNYASTAENTGEEVVSQLGTATYQEYVDRYIAAVPTDYISYDFYMYADTVDRAFSNLWTVADACRDTGRSLWIVLQVNSHREDTVMSLNQLRFQAYTALAFGAELISWGCYTKGWWYNNVLDENGEKTAQYDKLAAMNAELHAIGEPYMRYRRTATVFVGFDSAMRGATRQYNDGYLQDLCEESGAPLVVGVMIGRNTYDHAYLLCACDDPYDVSPVKNRVTFRAVGRTVRLHSGGETTCLLPDENGRYALDLFSSHGALLELTE